MCDVGVWGRRAAEGESEFESPNCQQATSKIFELCNVTSKLSGEVVEKHGIVRLDVLLETCRG